MQRLLVKPIMTFLISVRGSIVSSRQAALCILAVLITVFIVPVAAISIVPLTQAGTPFNASVYAQNTPQSDPMVFQCYWDGTGRVYLSGDQFSVTGIYADDGYTITVQPSGSVYDAPVHTAGLHAVIELTDGMRPGINTFTLVVRNWQGLSMSYGTVSGMDYQTPYIVQVIDSPVDIVPLGPAGTPFDSNKYAQNTPQSDPMHFHCYWDGTGRVYISGDKSSVTGIYADDGYTITVQPGGSVYDASDHWACQHPVIELTDGMHPGLNTFTLVVRNWQGLSMSYGKWPASNQTPYLVQVNDSTTVTAIRPASGQWGKLILTNITGTGFASGASVLLTKAGSNPISATNISVVSPTRITCTFKIPVYVPIGPWNVRVRNPVGTAGTKVNGFLVRAPYPPTVTAVTPSSGTQGTTVQISHLAGTGFALSPKPTIQLVRDGKTINATNITVINPNRITCTSEYRPMQIPACGMSG